MPRQNFLIFSRWLGNGSESQCFGQQTKATYDIKIIITTLFSLSYMYTAKCVLKHAFTGDIEKLYAML